MKTIRSITANETGFAVGVPVISTDCLMDALETEIRFSGFGHQATVLEAMRKILAKEKSNADK